MTSITSAARTLRRSIGTPLTVLTLAAICVGSLSVAGPTAEAANDINLTGNASTLYVHPEKQFSIAVPVGAEIIEREAPIDISIRARAGWVAHVQSGPRNPSENLEMLAAKLESHYLGADKPWHAKLSGVAGEVSGLPAYISVYQGSGSRARVVIVRARTLDIVIMFIAPEQIFENFRPLFDSMLASFQPPAAGVEAEAGAAMADLVEPAATVTGGGFREFRNGAMGISIGYPDHWRIDQPAPHMVVFSGVGASRNGTANASIQNVEGLAGHNPAAAADAILQEIMAQLAYSVNGVRHSRIEPFALAQASDAGGEGRHLLTDFVQSGTPFRQWSIALPRIDSATVHVFTFVAPSEAFDGMRDLAEGMIHSWTLTPVTR